MSKRSRRHEDPDFGEVDFKAVMSILVILIPVLIFAFNFFQVTIQRVEAPKVGKPKPNDAEKTEKLHLTIKILPSGFQIQQNADLVEVQLDPIPKRSVSAPDGAGQYDYPRLYSELRKIKKVYRDENQVNISGDPKVPWHVVARTIDAARVQLEKESYTSMKQYTKAPAPLTLEEKGSDGETVKIPEPMFDRVVFAVQD